MNEVVSIHQVVSPSNPSSHSITKMMEVLQRQGQIQPLQVRSVGKTYYVPFNEDPYAPEIIFAARALGWTTLMIVVVKRYEY